MFYILLASDYILILKNSYFFYLIIQLFILVYLIILLYIL